MFQPLPRFNLCLLKYFFCIYNALLEHYQVPLIPNTPDYRCPNPFTNQVLIMTNLKQVEALEVRHYIIMLNKQHSNPLKAQGPNLRSIFTIQKEMLTRFILRLA